MGKTPARNQRAAKGKKAEKKNVCDLCIGPAMTLVGEDHDTYDDDDDGDADSSGRKINVWDP